MKELILFLFFTVNAYGITPVGVKLISDFEGCALKTYVCPAGVNTIGFGNTKHARKGLTITKKQAIEWLYEDLKRFEVALDKKTIRILSWNQKDALLAFTFNLGSGVIKGKLQAAINSNSSEVPTIILSYCKARNPKTKQLVELRGLKLRRIAESKLYKEARYEGR